MSNIALLGPKPMVAFLSAAGIDVFACDSASQGKEALNKIVEGKNHALVFLTENLASELNAEIEFAQSRGINVAALPDHRGGGNYTRESLQSLIKKATGAAQL